MEGVGGAGSDGPLPGKCCIFRFKFIAFEAMLMCFISRSLSLKIKIYLPLVGTSGTGSKNWDCPRKIGTLSRPGIPPGLYKNRYSNSFFYLYSCEIIVSDFLTERLLFQRYLWEVTPNPYNGKGQLWLHQ